MIDKIVDGYYIQRKWECRNINAAKILLFYQENVLEENTELRITVFFPRRALIFQCSSRGISWIRPHWERALFGGNTNELPNRHGAHHIETA